MAKPEKVSPGSLGYVTGAVCYVFPNMVAAGVTPLVALLAPAVVFTVIAVTCYVMSKG